MKKLRYQAQFYNILYCILYTSISGAIVGTIVALYKFIAFKISDFALIIYDFINQNLAYLPLLYLGLIGFAIIMWLVLKYVPEVKGSGIPEIKAGIKGLITFKWLRILLGTFFSSMISFFVGLSLGSAGPFIQMGASASLGGGKFLKANPNWNRYLLRGGAAAGIATAFNAPLTGVIFSIEEAHDYFSPLIFIATLCSVLISTMVSNSIFDALGINELLFGLNVDYAFKISQIYYPIILGFVIGLSALLLNKLMIFIKNNENKIKIPNYLKLILIFLIVGTSNVFFKEGIGSGLIMIKKITTLNYVWYTILLFLLGKIALVMLAFKSNATGGLILPLLTIGALISALCAEVFIKMGLSQSAYNTIVVCGMAAFLGAVARTPLTALLAIIETSQFSSGFLAPFITVFCAYLFMEITLSTSIYDDLTNKLIKSTNEKKTQTVLDFDVLIEKGSFMDGKFVRDILWPQNFYILQIIRENENIPVKGHTEIQANDRVIAQATTYNPKEVSDTLNSLSKKRKHHSFLNIFKKNKAT